MTTTTDLYVSRVLHGLPRDSSMRQQIALELRGLIDERLANGEPETEVLRQLGDPARLAESYLSAIPLEPATFWARGLAKAVDVAVTYGIAAAVAGILVLIAWAREIDPLVVFAAAEFIIVGGLGLLIYTIVSEVRTGATLGKRLLHLQVVRESGGPISVGQAVVRQLPWMFQVFWIDALFALFTDRNQRAAELLSKTRVIRR